MKRLNRVRVDPQLQSSVPLSVELLHQGKWVAAMYHSTGALYVFVLGDGTTFEYHGVCPPWRRVA